jgi:uncharacterized membrane protein (Fun14 family)
MLLPRFSMRTILAVMTGCAVLSVLMGVAARGQMWAWGLVIGVASLGVTALVHAGWFGIVWLFSRLETRRASGAAVAEERT